MKLINLFFVLLMFFSVSVHAGHPEANADAEADAHAEADAEVDINFQPHSNTTNTTKANTKVNAEPAYAPSQNFDVSNQTCLAGVGVSLGVGGMFSGGYASTREDKQCTYRANLNHITTLYSVEIARAYAKKYLVGLDEVLNSNSDNSGNSKDRIGLKTGTHNNVVSNIPVFTTSMM